MKIRWKIFISVMTVAGTLFLLVIAILSNNFRKYSLSQTKKLTDSYAQQSANRAQTILGKDMSAMRTLADAFSIYNSIPQETRKPIFEDIMKSLLKSHPKYLSVWVSWELSSINEKWYKTHGRQRTLVLKNPDGTTSVIIDSVEIEKENYGSTYYNLKTSKNQEFIVDPYFYTYESEAYTDSILETSIAVQIRENEEYRGLVGIDVKLTELENITNSDIPIDSASMTLISNNGTLVAHKNKSHIGKSVKEILGKDYNEKEILNKIELGQHFSITSTDSLGGNEIYTTFVPFKVGGSNKAWSVGIAVPTEVITQAAYNNFYYSLLFGLIGFIILAGIIFILAANITRPLMRTVNLMHKLEKGEIGLKTDRSMKRSDEIGEMSRSIRKLLEKLNYTVEFAHKVGEGDFETKYELSSEKDRLGKALLNMQNNLSQADDERSKKEDESTIAAFIQKGVSTISDIAQSNNKDFQTLSEPIVKYIVKHLNIPQAAIFISEYSRDRLEKLELTYAYAYNKKKNIKDQYELGESLVGRCAKEQKTIILNEIPENYSIINSGLGEENPSHLILVPLVTEQKTQGILELAAFKPIAESSVEFLEIAAERIAAEILNIANDLETQKILNQLESKSDEMKASEAENKKIIAEMGKSSEVLEAQRFENSQIVKALSSVTSVVFYDTKGRITDLNQKNQQMFNIEKKDYIGKTHMEILPEARFNYKWFKQFWDDLRAGKTRDKTYYIENEDKEMWLHETFIPLKNEDDQVEQIINIGIDITEQKLLKRRLEELQG
ncbi:MAG: GAF domain-containing protein [Bacteroidota bacterium]|nr:GAF domain-containing protein [Bacteroidota bacterium]